MAGLPEGYRLVWADEFETPGAPDPTKWGYDTVANRTGWYNEELQYYSANRLENAEVRDGKLVISEKDPWAAKGYQLYGEMAEVVGLTWGGRWKSIVDLGHVELRRPGVKKATRPPGA